MGTLNDGLNSKPATGLPLPSNGPEAILRQTVDGIIQKVTTTAHELATQLDQKSPGHRHGLKKYQDHVQKMYNELPAITEAYGFGGETAQLARIIFAAHDLGRPRSALLEFDKKSVDPNHGQESLNELTERQIIGVLDTRQQFIVEFALINHSVRAVEPVDEITQSVRSRLGDCEDARAIAQLSCDLTYFLRDRDKVDILLKGPEYLEAPETLKELETWFLKKRPGLNLEAPFSEEDMRSSKFHEVAIYSLKHLLASSAGMPVVHAPTLDREMQQRVLPVLSAIMDGGIEPQTAKDFLASMACEKARVGYSYSTYMLYAVAFVFDVKHAATLREIKSAKILDPWLGFLELKLPESEFRKFRDHVLCYIEERLGGS